MGTTLEGLIEVQEPPLPQAGRPDALWVGVARWEFGKAYTLSMFLRDSACVDGWPPDPSADALQLQEECIADSGLMHAEGTWLCDGDVPELEGYAAEAYAALRAAIACFKRPVRVLFWSL